MPIYLYIFGLGPDIAKERTRTVGEFTIIICFELAKKRIGCYMNVEQRI